MQTHKRAKQYLDQHFKQIMKIVNIEIILMMKENYESKMMKPPGDRNEAEFMICLMKREISK